MDDWLKRYRYGTEGCQSWPGDAAIRLPVSSAVDQSLPEKSFLGAGSNSSDPLQPTVRVQCGKCGCDLYPITFLNDVYRPPGHPIADGKPHLGRLIGYVVHEDRESLLESVSRDVFGV